MDTSNPLKRKFVPPRLLNRATSPRGKLKKLNFMNANNASDKNQTPPPKPPLMMTTPTTTTPETNLQSSLARELQDIHKSPAIHLSTPLLLSQVHCLRKASRLSPSPPPRKLAPAMEMKLESPPSSSEPRSFFNQVASDETFVHDIPSSPHPESFVQCARPLDQPNDFFEDSVPEIDGLAAFGLPAQCILVTFFPSPPLTIHCW